jgi:hypothetical protein
MFIARWQFTVQSGQTDKCIALLQKWEIDVGQRIGWRPGSVRILKGFIGVSDGEVEFETHFDSLSDLEGAWNDMARSPHHGEYMKLLEPLMVSGTTRWTIYRECSLSTAD